MSGGGGGIIIIRKSLRMLAGLETVQQNITPAKAACLNSILEKNEFDWTRADVKMILRLIEKADAELS